MPLLTAVKSMYVPGGCRVVAACMIQMTVTSVLPVPDAYIHLPDARHLSVACTSCCCYCQNLNSSFEGVLDKSCCILQDEDVAAYLKLTSKEKLAAVTKAAAVQKQLKQQIKELEEDLKVGLFMLHCYCAWQV